MDGEREERWLGVREETRKLEMRGRKRERKGKGGRV